MDKVKQPCTFDDETMMKISNAIPRSQEKRKRPEYAVKVSMRAEIDVHRRHTGKTT